MKHLPVDTLLRQLRALANRHRLRVFCLAATEPGITVGAIAGKLQIKQPFVSQIIGQLQDAGLLLAERRGLFVHCRVPQDALRTVAAFASRPAGLISLTPPSTSVNM